MQTRKSKRINAKVEKNKDVDLLEEVKTEKTKRTYKGKKNQGID